VQVACQKYWSVTHEDAPGDGVGNHPNKYFEESVKFYQVRIHLPALPLYLHAVLNAVMCMDMSFVTPSGQAKWRRHACEEGTTYHPHLSEQCRVPYGGSGLSELAYALSVPTASAASSTGCCSTCLLILYYHNTAIRILVG